jgi:UDP-N-acetylmuramoyl-L-alanyl-D-glutamate--2,6-diaminopimelate ligase
MLTIGVVGSHGKTTTALYIAAALKRLAGGVAYYTSLGSSDSQTCDRSSTRAPGTAKLAGWMQRADSAGAPAAIVELSDAMLSGRVDSGVEFDLIVITGMRTGQMRGCPSGAQAAQMHRRLLESLNLMVSCWSMATMPRQLPLRSPSRLPSPIMAWMLANKFAESGCRGGGRAANPDRRRQYVDADDTENPWRSLRSSGFGCRGYQLDHGPARPETISAVESLEAVPGRMQRLPQSIDVPIYIDQGQSPDRVAVALHALKSHQLGPATVVMDLSSQLASQWRIRLARSSTRGLSVWS